MKEFINNLLESGKKFTWFDWFLFKICLLVLGIILGVYFYTCLSSYLKILWIIFIVTFVYMAYVSFIKYFPNNKKK